MSGAPLAVARVFNPCIWMIAYASSDSIVSAHSD
jgi:hypothetical protein